MRRTPRRAPLLLTVLLAVWLASATAAGAQEAPTSGDVTWSASLNGADVETSDGNRPATLTPGAGAEVMVNVSNGTDRTLEIRSVDLDGRVLGLTFFSYATRVDLRVAPGSTGTRTFSIDLGDLEGQATGLLPARLTLMDPERQVIAERSLTVEVQGSLASVYGVFGLVVAASTAVLLVLLLVRLATSRLPVNRWRRATRFGVVGVGLGLTATFTLSALSLRSPDAATWVGVVLLGGVGAFTLGYLSPTPSRDTDTDDVEDEDDEAYDDLLGDRMQPLGPPAAGEDWAGPPPQTVPGRAADHRTPPPPPPPAFIDLRDPAPADQPPVPAPHARQTIRGQSWPPSDAK